MMTKYLKTVIISLIVLLLIFVGFTYLRGKDGSDEVLESVESEEVIGRDIIAKLDQLNSLKLDESVFSDEVFLSFKDFTLTVSPESRGRSNPFAPF